MTRPHRTIFLFAIAFALAACSNKKEIRAAKHSLYNIDFAIVYSAALQATRELYSNIDDNPGAGAIRTAWHQVQYASSQEDMTNPRTVAQGQGVSSGNSTTSPGAQAGGMPTRLAYKRYFIRFDITVAGGRPWRVKVIGHAAEWDPGNAMPTELRGMARPPWLDGRTDALQVAIYRKIQPYAVPMKDEEPEQKPELALPKTDPTTIKGVPAPVAAQLAAIKDAIGRRDYGALRAKLADDVVWSLGGAPGADTAMAMWQADPDTLEAMARLVSGGCGTADNRVACPAGPAVPGAWQLVLEPRGATWKVTSFVKAE